MSNACLLDPACRFKNLMAPNCSSLRCTDFQAPDPPASFAGPESTGDMPLHRRSSRLQGLHETLNGPGWAYTRSCTFSTWTRPHGPHRMHSPTAAKWTRGCGPWRSLALENTGLGQSRWLLLEGHEWIRNSCSWRHSERNVKVLPS